MKFIIVYDDDNGVSCPFGWDTECEGAVCCYYFDGVAVFESRKDARKSIRISTAFAKLRKAQGDAVNDDFIGGLKNIRIVPLKPKEVKP